MLAGRWAHPIAAIVRALVLGLALTRAAAPRHARGAKARLLQRPKATPHSGAVIDGLQVVERADGQGVRRRDPRCQQTREIRACARPADCDLHRRSRSTHQYSHSQLRLQASQRGRVLRAATSNAGGSQVWRDLVDRGVSPLAGPLHCTAQLSKASPQPHHGSAGVGR